MAQIVRAKPIDHAGEVVLYPTASFDLDKTIFGAITSPLLRFFQKSKLGVNLYWSEAAAQRIRTRFLRLPKTPKWDKGVVDFIHNQCDFAMEHADGSFLDHLKFCHEYSHAHFPGQSPRVLLLHSIMGVGTNFFPMTIDKIPQLKNLLTSFEYRHIEMFPSMLRLYFYGPLRYELESMSKEQLASLTSIQCHRVIDNKVIQMNGENFWIQLNYHLIHLLDFLPAASWKLHAGDNFLDSFTALYGLLERAGKLFARVDFDASESSSMTEGQPNTLASMVRSWIPPSIQLHLAKRQIGGFSAEIGHSLEYTLTFAATDRQQKKSAL
jgi:hypothetical protein